MKKVADLMKDLGFKEGASEEVAKAFIKNLIREAYGVEVKIPNQMPTPNNRPQIDFTNRKANSPASFEQLEFDLSSQSKPKKLA